MSYGSADYIRSLVDFGAPRRLAHAENVLVRRDFHPGCHNMEPYRSEAPDQGWRLPHTDEICRRVMVLPTGTAVTPEDIIRMAGVMARIPDHAPAVTAALKTRENES